MRVLVAIDFGECSRDAARWSLEHLRAPATDRYFLHVLPETSEPATSDANLEGLEGAATRMRELVAQAADGVVVDADPAHAKYTVVRGAPVDAVLKAIDTFAIEHVVLGTHGRKGLERWWVGSVAENVTRRAPVGVTVVKRRPEGQA